MEINEDEKQKIMATKPPSFTMKVLRPLANLFASYTSPSQVSSVARQFGFEESAKNPDEVAAALLRMFEILRDEENDEDIRKIIETLLTLYAHLIDERVHEKGLIGPARKILWLGHFNIAFHAGSKSYIVAPCEGPVHGIAMRAEGMTEQDFQDNEKRKLRKAPVSYGNKKYITKVGDDFVYKGGVINLPNKDKSYYRVFCVLYEQCSMGGEIEYKKLSKFIKKRIPSTKNHTREKMQKYINTKLRDKREGFMKKAGISDFEDNGKPLVGMKHGWGIIFNNKVG